MSGHAAQIRAVLERHTADLLAPAARDEKVSRRVWASLRRDLRALGFGRFETWRAVRQVKARVAKGSGRPASSSTIDSDLVMAEAVGGVLEGALQVLVAFFDG